MESIIDTLKRSNDHKTSHSDNNIDFNDVIESKIHNATERRRDVLCHAIVPSTASKNPDSHRKGGAKT
ncbi:hypothetical protein [Halobacillus karajensis]|uniref:hypothetical protein n=1 Tax=Halobacillus karajensis TaxID=195088 RepID=UPI00054CDC42|nr:hypothetical protein [Halobacillus karajensis]